MCKDCFRTSSLLLIVILALSSALQRCKVKDGDCLRLSAQSGAPTLARGIPEVGSEPLDPMFVDTIKVELAGLKMAIKNAHITGLRNVAMDDVRIDTTNKVIRFKYHVDIRLKGQYKASGRLLILPISGEGNTTIALRNLQVELSLAYEVTKSGNGQDIVVLQSYSFKYDIRDNAHFHLTNLFNGNKILSETMLRFMNENWKILSQEFGSYMLDKPTSKIYEALKKYLRSQPLRNLVDY